MELTYAMLGLGHTTRTGVFSGWSHGGSGWRWVCWRVDAEWTKMTLFRRRLNVEWVGRIVGCPRTKEVALFCSTCDGANNIVPSVTEPGAQKAVNYRPTRRQNTDLATKPPPSPSISTSFPSLQPLITLFSCQRFKRRTFFICPALPCPHLESSAARTSNSTTSFCRASFNIDCLSQQVSAILRRATDTPFR